MTPDTGFPIDAHVHLHPAYDLAASLSSAAAQMGGSGALMLTECAWDDAFAALTGQIGDWTIAETAEPVSRIATRADGARLILIAGRQTVTAEGLEVLALGLAAAPPDGQPMDDTLDGIAHAGALAVLPWGFGKWSGARGALLDRLIDDRAGAPDIFLADSGVRAAAMARPAQLARAEALGWRVLAGTDPLPLQSDQGKPGRFGFRLDSAPDPDRPFADIAARLKALPHSPPTYGPLVPLLPFLRQQLAMQLRKRFG